MGALAHALYRHLPQVDEARRLVDLMVDRLPVEITEQREIAIVELLAGEIGPFLARLWNEGYGDPRREVELRLAPAAVLREVEGGVSNGAFPAALAAVRTLIEELPPGRGAQACRLDLARLEGERTSRRGRVLYRRVRRELLRTTVAEARKRALRGAFHRLSLPVGILRQELPRYLEFLASGGPQWPISSFGWRAAEGRWSRVDWDALLEMTADLAREPTVERLARRIARLAVPLRMPDPRETAERRPPIIVVLDTSGSMRGEPERVSRALIFGLLIHAGRSERSVRLVYGGRSVTHREFVPGAPAVATLPEELSLAFRSGGSAVPALRDVLYAALKRDEELADILFITDSRDPRLSPATEQQLHQLRRRTNLLLHGMTVAELPLINRANLFDYTWHYASSRTLRPGIASQQFTQL